MKRTFSCHFDSDGLSYINSNGTVNTLPQWVFYRLLPLRNLKPNVFSSFEQWINSCPTNPFDRIDDVDRTFGDLLEICIELGKYKDQPWFDRVVGVLAIVHSTPKTEIVELCQRRSKVFTHGKECLTFDDLQKRVES